VLAVLELVPQEEAGSHRVPANGRSSGSFLIPGVAGAASGEPPWLLGIEVAIHVVKWSGIAPRQGSHEH
jgi:hypothetical protein